MHRRSQSDVPDAASTITFLGGGNMARSLVEHAIAAATRRGRELSAANESPAP